MFNQFITEKLKFCLQYIP